MIISGSPSRVNALLQSILQNTPELSRDEHEARKAVRRDMEREWYRQADEAEAQAQSVEWICDKWLDVGLLGALTYGAADLREIPNIEFGSRAWFAGIDPEEY